MNGNNIWIVCKPCSDANEKDFGVCLAQRPSNGFYEHLSSTPNLDKWLWNHRNCGGKIDPDHFKLGYGKQQNHDMLVPKPDEPVKAAVKLALVK